MYVGCNHEITGCNVPNLMHPRFSAFKNKFQSALMHKKCYACRQLVYTMKLELDSCEKKLPFMCMKLAQVTVEKPGPFTILCGTLMEIFWSGSYLY